MGMGVCDASRACKEEKKGPDRADKGTEGLREAVSAVESPGKGLTSESDESRDSDGDGGSSSVD
jgi:hypothetical protein